MIIAKMTIQKSGKKSKTAAPKTSAEQVQVASNLDQAAKVGKSLSAAPSIAGRFYVYALKDPASPQPFYIGKGAYDRALKHFRISSTNASSGVLDGERLQDLSDATDEKQDTTIGVSQIDIIEAELADESTQEQQGNPGHPPAENAKHRKIRELKDSGVPPKDIARVLARGLSREAALAIEALLIKGVYGKENLTNIASGYHDERFRASDDWEYQEGFDLPLASGGSFQPDDQQHSSGIYYVYVLRDPEQGRIFYVGKGKADRLCQHFKNAVKGADPDPVPRLKELKGLLDKGHRPDQIGRVIARVDSEALALAIESFYMKFVVGFSLMHNDQPGHRYGIFRSRGDWKALHGFDLPIHVAGGMRTMLYEMFISEGLDEELTKVVRSSELAPYLGDVTGPKLMGAGELGYECMIKNVSNEVSLKVFVRCSRRIQIELRSKNQNNAKWVKENFGRFGLYPIHRGDDVFKPLCWKGTKNMKASHSEIIARTVKFAKLIQILQNAESFEELQEFKELLDKLPCK